MLCERGERLSPRTVLHGEERRNPRAREGFSKTPSTSERDSHVKSKDYSGAFTMASQPRSGQFTWEGQRQGPPPETPSPAKSQGSSGLSRRRLLGGSNLFTTCSLQDPRWDVAVIARLRSLRPTSQADGQGLSKHIGRLWTKPMLSHQGIGYRLTRLSKESLLMLTG